MKRSISFLLALVMLLGVGAFCVSADEQSEVSDFPFADVPATRWSNPYVALMYNEGIVGGVSPNLFAPADNVTRAQFVKILCGVAGGETEGHTHTFTDVVAGSWYEPYVAWAASYGIVNGMTPTTFAPDAQVSRQDMATMIYRYVTLVLYPEVEEEQPTEGRDVKYELLGEPVPAESTEITETVGDTTPSEPLPPEPLPPEESSGLPVVNEPVAFTDDADIAVYAKEAVSAMQQAGIIGGVGNPDGTFRFEPKNNATREQACKMLGELYLIINEEKVLPAPVEPCAYLITYDLGGGKLNGLKKVYTKGESFTLGKPTRDGYIFEGWSGSGIDGHSQYVTVPEGTVGPLTFKAIWKQITYTVTYSLNGGVCKSALKYKYTKNDTFTLPTPTREGYEFLGWSGTGINGMAKSVTVKKGSTGDRSYAANWRADSKQTIAFDYLYNWVNKNGTANSSGNKIVSATTGSGNSFVKFSFVAIPAVKTTPRSVKCILSYGEDGFVFTTTLILYPESTSRGIFDYSYPSGNYQFFHFENNVKGKINENMAISLNGAKGELKGDAEMRDLAKDIYIGDMIYIKQLINVTYSQDIKVYGYDLSSFGH